MTRLQHRALLMMYSHIMEAIRLIILMHYLQPHHRQNLSKRVDDLYKRHDVFLQAEQLILETEEKRKGET